MKRFKTDYPGVFYREGKRIGGRGKERIYYVVYKKEGKTYEEKVGRQHADDMTPSRAATIRGELIEGKRLTRKESREKEEARKKAEGAKWTIDRLWEGYKGNRVRNKGLRTDEGRYNKYIKPSFGNKEPKDIIMLDVDRLKRRALKGLAPQSVKHILDLLTRIINYGSTRNLCDPLPFRVEKPRVNNLKTEDLNPGQLEKLMKAIEADQNIQAKNLMKMALFTGMRRGELFKLKWKDIDDHRGFIHIKDPKGGPDQKVPLNDGAREVLKNHIKTSSPYVFPGRGGHKRVDINKQVNRIKKAAGLPKDFRPLHGLRHAYASMLASSGKVDMYTLQKLLTHKDPRMTQRYAHLRDEALKKASNLAGDLINEALSGKSEEKVGKLEDHKE
jgi:integrase